MSRAHALMPSLRERMDGEVKRVAAERESQEQPDEAADRVRLEAPDIVATK